MAGVGFIGAGTNRLRRANIIGSKIIRLVQDIASDASGTLLDDVTADGGWLAGATIPTQQTLSAVISGIGVTSVTLNTDGSVVESDDWSDALLGLTLEGSYYASIEGVTLTQGGEEITARLTFGITVPQSHDIPVHTFDTLNNADTETNGNAFDGTVIKATQDAENIVEHTLPNHAGRWDLELVFFDENDGVEEYRIGINGVWLDHWLADQNGGSSTANADSQFTRTLTDLELPANSTIQIGHTRDTFNAPARLDVVHLTASTGPELAFQGAMGFGRSAQGGKGGTELLVTSLANSGPGSLREACAVAGPTIIKFDVEGEIALTDQIQTSGYTTIDNSTSPGDGVVITGGRLNPIGSHIIVKGFKSRAGDNLIGQAPAERDCIGVGDGANIVQHVMIVDCSFAWSVDEIGSVWGSGASDITYQGCIFAEALAKSIHTGPEEEHSMGFIVGGGASRVTVVRCLFASNQHRNPQFNGVLECESINNAIYNYGDNGTQFVPDGSTPTTAHAIGNVFLRGPNSHREPFQFGDSSVAGCAYYLSDNIQNSLDWGLIDEARAGIADVTASHAFTPSNTPCMRAADVQAYVLANVGAKRLNGTLDATDQRIINSVTDNTGAIVDAPVVIGAVTAPVSAGGLADSSFVQDIAISAINVASDFTGDDITYALAPTSASLPAGLSLATNGQITGTPTTPAAEVNIVVRATNAGGYADTAFGVTVTVFAAIEILSVPTAPGEFIEYLPGSTTSIISTVSEDDTPVSAETLPTALGVNDASIQNMPYFTGGVEIGDEIQAYKPDLHFTTTTLVERFEWYLGGVATGVTGLKFKRPDSTASVVLHYDVLDGDGNVIFHAEFPAAATNVPVIPPTLEDITINQLVSTTQTQSVYSDEEDPEELTLSNLTKTSGNGTLGTFNADGSYEFTTTGVEDEDTVLEATIANSVASSTKVITMTGVAAAQAGVGVIEAEAMTFDNFFFDWNFGVGVIALQNAPEEPTPGTARAIFAGESGTYNLGITGRTDTDADSREVWVAYVNGVKVASWSAQGASNGFAPMTAVEVDLNTGDEIIITGLGYTGATGAVYAAFDSMTISEAVSASYPDFGEVVQSDENINGAGTVFGATPTTGNIILLSTIEDNGGAVMLPSGYVQIANEENTTDSGGLGPRMVTAYKVSDGTETSEQAISMVGSGKRSHIAAELDVSGGGTLSQVQVVSDDGDGGVTVVVDTGDTVRAIVFVAVGYARETAISAYTSTAGWTLVDGSVSGGTNAPAILLFSKELTSGGTDSFTFSASAGANTTRGTIATAWVIRGT